MMSVQPEFSQHNQQQIDYFEGTFKKTMAPQETPYLRRHVEKLVEFGSITKEDRCLEIGCGMGRYLLLMAAMGFQMEGIDLTPGLLDWLRKFDAGRFNIKLHCLDVLDRPAELAGAFDVVLTLFTLHHVHDITATMQAMKFYTHPGGRIVMLEPNPYNPLYYAQILATPGMSWQAEKGMLHMTHRRLSEAASAAGLQDFKMQRFGMFPPFVVNRPLGARLERIVERIPGIRLFDAFQLISAVCPPAEPG